MNSQIDQINCKLRPALKLRVGTQSNVDGARTMLQKQNKRATYSGGELAYAMFLEAVQWSDSVLQLNFENLSEINDSVVNGVQNICAKANNTHSTGTKVAAGFAAGLHFGVIPSLVGALIGWGVGKNASNNDLNSIIMYANQAVDFFVIQFFKQCL